MIRHLFKLIWNQKRKNLGLSFELFFSYLVLFGVFSFCFFFLKRYMQPLGFQYEQVWQIELGKGVTPDSLGIIISDQIKSELRKYPEIISFSNTAGNTPFSFNSMISESRANGNSSSTDMFRVDRNYIQTLDINIVAGRWFDDTDVGNTKEKIVITQKLAMDLFNQNAPIGEQLNFEDEGVLHTVIGVVEDYRYRGNFEELKGAIFQLKDPNSFEGNLLLKVGPEADANFEAKLVKDIRSLTPGWTITVEHLSERRATFMQIRTIPMLLLSIVSGFLIFNVALGLFGVLWQKTSQRKGEIGIRRAMGATKRAISLQFIGEILALTTLSIALGLFFAIQFPLLNVLQIPADIYIYAIIAALLTIYLVVFLCAFFPSQQAAQLEPAIALHED